MRIHRFILLLNILFLNLVVSCQSSSLQIRDGDKVDGKLEEYCLLKLMDSIKSSDFCIVGQIRVKSKEVLTETSIMDSKGKVIRKEPDEWRMTGEVEVTSVIYGDPGTKFVPFSTTQTKGRVLDYGAIESDEYPFIRSDRTEAGKDHWFFLFPEEGDTFIIIGKGQDKDAVVTQPIRPEDVNDMQSRVESIRTIRNIEIQPEAKQRKARQKLLAKSNNTELLIYLFCRSFNEGGLDRQIDIVKTLFIEEATQERRFISFWLANSILTPPGSERSNGEHSEHIPYHCYEHFLKITPQQREILNDIIIKSLIGINTIGNGVIYLRTVDSRTLEKDKDLKERVKKVIVELSKQFEKDKNYPEWQKAVKELFPDEAPKPNEAKPDKKGK